MVPLCHVNDQPSPQVSGAIVLALGTMVMEGIPNAEDTGADSLLCMCCAKVLSMERDSRSTAQKCTL